MEFLFLVVPVAISVVFVVIASCVIFIKYIYRGSGKDKAELTDSPKDGGTKKIMYDSIGDEDEGGVKLGCFYDW